TRECLLIHLTTDGKRNCRLRPTDPALGSSPARHGCVRSGHCSWLSSWSRITSSPSESKLAAKGPQLQPGSWAPCSPCAGTPPGMTPAAPGISPHRGAVSPPAPAREGGIERSYGLLATHRS